MSITRKALAGFAVLAVTTLSACSGDEDKKSEEQAPQKQDSAIVKVKDHPGTSKDFEGALEDVDLKKCETKGGALEVSGTVTNPKGSAQTYRIYVSAMKKDDTRALVQVDVPSVDPDGTEKWGTKIQLKDDGMDCTLRVERSAA